MMHSSYMYIVITEMIIRIIPLDNEYIKWCKDYHLHRELE
jgi:hypothetical protein